MPLISLEADIFAKELLICGNKNHDNKLYDDALFFYDKALNLPSDKKLVLYLAKARTLTASADQTHNEEDYNKALECYEEAMKLAPTRAETYYLKAKLLQTLGKFDLAIPCFQKVIEYNPKNIGAHYNLATSLNALGQTKEALSHFNIALDLNPLEARAYYNKGVALQTLGKHAEAIESYRQAYTINPEDSNAYHNHGDALFKCERYEDAIISFNKVLALDPEDTLAYVNKAVALNQLGKTTDALVYFKQAVELVKAGKYGKAVSAGNCFYISETLNQHCAELLSKTEELAKLEASDESATLSDKTETDLAVKEAADLIQSTVNGVDKDKEILALIERMNELEKSFVRRQEVSYAIRQNAALEAKHKEQTDITADLALNDYYRSFNSSFNQNFVASLALASGKIPHNITVLNLPVDDLGKLIPVPFVSEIAQAVCTITNTALKIREGNRVKRLAAITLGVTDMEDKIEQVARKITLNKQAEIKAVTDSTHWIMALVKNVKDKLVFNAYDTPQKKLGLSHASKLLMACMCGEVDPEEDLVLQLTNLLLAQIPATLGYQGLDDNDAAQVINTGAGAMPIMIEGSKSITQAAPKLASTAEHLAEFANPLISNAGSNALTSAKTTATVIFDVAANTAENINQTKDHCCCVVQ